MRLASDSGAFADWIASSSSGGDLSLGFNAGGTTMAHPSNNGQDAVAGGMWPSAAHGRHVNDGLQQDFFLLAPASSFQHHHPNVATVGNATVNVDPHSLNASNAIGIGVGVIPLVTATPCLATARSLGNEDAFNNAHNRGGMRQWQHQQVQNSSAYLKKSMTFDHPSEIGGASSSSISGGSTICQDCGNQAKKDCPHRRCRTCCKSRGYDCPTHVRSTWVPAARRRERQLVAETTATAAGSSQSTSGAKKPKLGGASQTTTTTASHTSNSNTTPPRSFDTTSSHRDASFRDSLPGQVRAPAVFKCVKVTALDDGEDEYAYQAAVRIGGHLFQGFLYDQGFEEKDEFPNMSELHLSGGGGGVIDPSEIYAAASGGGLLGGPGYGNPIN